MNEEQIRIFNEQGTPIGIKTRDEAHKKGCWHETFHCWFVEQTAAGSFIFMQQRCHAKKDFPDLYDITAAGHIKADETISDAIREIHEELGVPVQMEELLPLGVIRDEIVQGDFIDRERCHVFLCVNHYKMNAFKLQKEEVSGIYKAAYPDFAALVRGAKQELELAGFDESNGERVWQKRTVDRKQCVPHSPNYYIRLIGKLAQLPLF
ncbi:NUDIX domain-containing protein [Sporolactobacillus sp. STCC-11]|uniref:NUDIX hydrolase n=1 Tax=Sporolactobacillus caesalpiniae TaxID=3230362 RepID=UPI003395385F